MRIHAVKFGVAFGVLYSLTFFLYGMAAAFFGIGGEIAKMIGDLYVGFAPTPMGAVIGAVWGFAVGLVFFGLGAAIYNRLIDDPAAN
jgi:hypothetical protein